MPIINLLDFHHSVADAKRLATELYQKVVAGQPQVAERLAASLDAIERSRKLLSAERQD
jgi:hypothetical protein